MPNDNNNNVFKKCISMITTQTFTDNLHLYPKFLRIKPTISFEKFTLKSNYTIC